MNTFDKLVLLSKENMGDLLPKEGDKWGFAHSRDEEHWSMADSREDALAEGMAEAKDIGYDRVYIAPAKIPDIPRIPSGALVDILQDKSFEYMPEDAHFLEKVTIEQEDELEDLVHGVVCAWIQKHNLYPKWYSIDMDKIEEIEVPEQE